MAAHVELAQRFGELIAKEDYASAHKMLTRKARKEWPVREMKKRSVSMRGYAPGPFREMKVMDEFILEEWPAMQDGDVASIYISLSGDGFCEAVSIIVAAEDDELRIRELEWGRP